MDAGMTEGSPPDNDTVANVTEMPNIYMNPGWALAIKYGMSYYYTSPDVIIFVIAMIPLTIFGTFGNLLIIASVLKSKDLRTINNAFVVNLAVSNLLISVVINPFNAIGVFEGESFFIPRLRLLCDAVTTICTLGCTSALYNMGLIGMNRYFHIVRNEWYRRLYNKGTTIGLCLFAWFAPFMLQALPPFLGFGGLKFEWKTLACTIDRTANYMYNLFIICIAFGIPISLTVFFYLAVFFHVAASKKRIAAMQGANGKAEKGSMADKANKESMRLARTVFIIFLSFITMYTPWSLIVALDRYDQVPRPLYLFATICGHGSSGTNFLVYGLSNVQFKRAYIRLLRLDKCSASMKARLEDGSTVGSSVATDDTSVGRK